ncbi:hypothetical protein [Lachnospira multipara]|jgi:hypothetical protein|uniref:hypothetical protein n=1 Tax=Lachnospira multipara TaxID=28051 RepID=UPI0004802B82|nr:hypothetical protein [Lachnospira multipara]
MSILNEDYSSLSAEELEAKKRQILSLTANDIREEFVNEANQMLLNIKKESDFLLTRSIKIGVCFLICVLVSAFVIFNCIKSPYKVFIIAALTMCCMALLIVFIHNMKALKIAKIRVFKSESEVEALKKTTLSETQLNIFKMQCFKLIEENIANTNHTN